MCNILSNPGQHTLVKHIRFQSNNNCNTTYNFGHIHKNKKNIKFYLYQIPFIRFYIFDNPTTKTVTYIFHADSLSVLLVNERCTSCTCFTKFVVCLHTQKVFFFNRCICLLNTIFV